MGKDLRGGRPCRKIRGCERCLDRGVLPATRLATHDREQEALRLDRGAGAGAVARHPCQHGAVRHPRSSVDRVRRLASFVLIFALDGVIAYAFLLDARRTPIGVDQAGVLFEALVVVVLFGWTIAVALGLWVRQSWALVAGLITYGLIAVGALVAAVDLAWRLRSDELPLGTGSAELFAPAVIAVGAGAVVVLLATGARSDG